MRNKINYLLVNLCLLFSIIFLIYLSRNIWINLFSILFKVFSPFIYAFFIAYFFNPFINFFKKLFGKFYILFFLFFLVIFILIFIYFIFPIISFQFVSFINYLISFLEFISSKYNFNLSILEDYLFDFIKLFGNNITSVIFNLFGSIFSFIFNFFIIVSISIYFIIDMDKLKKIFYNFSSFKFYNILVISNNELRNYFNAFFKIMFISFFEYLFVYKIIGHPYFFVLGILTSLFSIIPVLGNSFINILACITSLVVSRSLFFRCIIVIFILSIIDSYVINPIIFGNSNNVHPIVIIFSIVVGGLFGGVIGVIVSLPLIIIILKIIKLYGVNYFNLFKKKI